MHKQSREMHWRDTKRRHRVRPAPSSAPKLPTKATLFSLREWAITGKSGRRRPERSGNIYFIWSNALPPKSVCNTLPEPLSESVPLHTLGRHTAPAIQRPHVLGFSSASSNALPALCKLAARGNLGSSRADSTALFRSSLGLGTLIGSDLPLDISSSKISARLLAQQCVELWARRQKQNEEQHIASSRSFKTLPGNLIAPGTLNNSSKV